MNCRLLAIAVSVAATAGVDQTTLRNLCRDAQSLDHTRQAQAIAALKGYSQDTAGQLVVLLRAQNEEDLVRAGAAVGISLYGEQGRRFLPELAGALDDKSLAVQQAAAGALAALVRPGDSHVVVPSLVKRLVGRPVNCSFECFWSIQALERVGPTAGAAIPVLREIVQDRRMSSNIQAAAMSALRVIRGGTTRERE